MHRPKMSPKGLRRGAAELLVRPIPIGPNQTEFSHGVSHRVQYDSSWVYHLISLPEDPPLRGLYKEEESPPLHTPPIRPTPLEDVVLQR